VGGLVVKKGELVIISDENFWMYMTEDTALFQWDPPTPLDVEQADVLLDIQVSERRGEVEICAIPASGIPDLDIGWSLKVYHTRLNPRGCNAFTLPDDSSFLGGQISKAVVVDRGECTFLQKAELAKQAGYDLVIVVDSSLTAGQRFIPSLLTDKGVLAPSENIVPLVLVTGRRDASLIQRAEKVRIAGTRARERRMVVRGGELRFKGNVNCRICDQCSCQTIKVVGVHCIDTLRSQIEIIILRSEIHVLSRIM